MSGAQAVKLMDMVEYQTSAVVSRALLDKKTGTITLFAFDTGQGLSEHTAPYDAMAYILDGEVEVIVSGKSVSMKQGDMVVMPGGEPHALRAVKRFKMLLVMIKS